MLDEVFLLEGLLSGWWCRGTPIKTIGGFREEAASFLGLVGLTDIRLEGLDTIFLRHVLWWRHESRGSALKV